MTVYVNTRALQRQTTGVERYTRELLAHLDGRLRRLGPGRKLPGWAGSLWEQLAMPRFIPKRSLLWSPANSGPAQLERQVISLHDLSALEHPEWYRPGFATWCRYMVPEIARRAAAIIVSSAFTRQRVLALLRVPPEKVTLIPCGVNELTFYPRPATEVDRLRARYALAGPYVLTVGSLQPRKNLARLLEAWQVVHQQHPTCTLVIAGGSGAVFRPLELPKGIPGVRFLGYVPDPDLPALYSAALAFVYPSLYEGFGLPLLEAMACGLPVAASATTSLPEVVGEAGLLFDPMQTGAIQHALDWLIGDAALRRHLAAHALARARTFRWQSAAQAVWQVLQGTLEGSDHVQ